MKHIYSFGRSGRRAPLLYLAVVLVVLIALAGCLSIPAKSTHEVDVNVSGVQPAGPPAAASTGSRSLSGSTVTNLTQLDVSGNAAVGGDLTVTGAVSANGSITDSGQLAMKGIAVKPTAATTATPALLINNSSVAANDAISAQLIGTPVFRVGNAGDTMVGGALSVTGASSNTGLVVVPTAQTTATPAVYVNNKSTGGNDNLVVAANATPVFKVGSSGNTTVGGSLSVSGSSSNGGLAVAATAQATATPAAYINNASATGADSLVVANSGSPVLKVSQTGLVTGYVLRYASSGKAIVCNTTTITGTGTLAHGLATPSAVMVNMGADAVGDHARVTFTNSGGAVTAKVWNSALTPAPAATGVPIDWCVIGTP
jgi:hypothetical protein